MVVRSRVKRSFLQVETFVTKPLVEYPCDACALTPHHLKEDTDPIEFAYFARVPGVRDKEPRAAVEHSIDVLEMQLLQTIPFWRRAQNPRQERHQSFL